MQFDQCLLQTVYKQIACLIQSLLQTAYTRQEKTVSLNFAFISSKMVTLPNIAESYA